MAITNATIQNHILLNVDNLRAIESFDVSQVTDLSNCFEGMNVTGIDLSRWNTKNVTTMNGMFRGCIFGWDNSELNLDTSNVTDMGNMFANCRDFVRDISEWNTSKVTNMSEMFIGCYEFKGDISFDEFSDCWNTKNVTTMNGMFQECYTLNENALVNWDTSNVVDMSHMFHDVPFGDKVKFDWDTSKVTNMSSMFMFTSQVYDNGITQDYFNMDLSDWNTSNVVDMSHMFFGRGKFNRDISQWETGNVTNMSTMFGYCCKFSCDISGWDTSSVTEADNMFAGCSFPKDKMPIFRQPPDPYRLVIVNTPNGNRIGHLIFVAKRFGDSDKYAVIKSIAKYLYTVDENKHVNYTKDKYVKLNYKHAMESWAYLPRDIETKVGNLNKHEIGRTLLLTRSSAKPRSFTVSRRPALTSVDKNENVTDRMREVLHKSLPIRASQNIREYIAGKPKRKTLKSPRLK